MLQALSIFVHARSQRALAAVILIVALAVMFVFHTHEMEDAKNRSMFAVSATSWKVSELIHESLRFSNDARGFANGEVSLDALRLRFDILWSRVDVVENTDINGDPQLHEILEEYRVFLEAGDPLVFGPAPISRDAAFAEADKVTALSTELRIRWVAAFAGRQFGDVTLEIIEREQGMKRQTLIALLLVAIAIYLVTEIFRADVARRKEARLEAEAAAAEMASATKSRFLANVSHEIRTPLNGILGMATELQETELDDDQRSCLKVISHAGDVLLHTLNDVLDLSKVESGQMELEHIVFDLYELTDSAVALYRARAEAKGLKLRFYRDKAIPNHVMGDGRRISQVLHNLIGNAVKFTDSGEIHVLVSRAPKDGFLRFCVVDSGVGIAPSAHAKIFEPFSQADSSVTRKKGGTGLGLSICRHLCDAMGGKLDMKSVPNEGATFWFDLPLEAHSAPDEMTVSRGAVADESKRPIGGTRRVLVVDDNSTNRLLLKRFLKDQDVEITEVDDGAKALAAAKADFYDVIFMDVQMPVMDGIEATNHIRTFELTAKRPPSLIVAVTANVMRHQVDEYLSEGVDEVMGKPVSKAHVIKLLGGLRQDAA